MELVLSAVTMGRALRAKHQLKIRQPLRQITLITATPEAQRILEDLGELITDELNVKSVEISRDEKDLVELSAKANFKLLGRRMGKKMKSVSQAIAAMSPARSEITFSRVRLNSRWSRNPPVLKMRKS